MINAFLGVGSNLNYPVTQVKNGIAAVAKVPGIYLVKQSSLYKTQAIGPAQPDFINAVLKIETTLEAQVLLKTLMQIEEQHNRVRSDIQFSPRTLDLDILLYGDVNYHLPELTIPHPRMQERAFVLVPLLEIAPEYQSIYSLSSVLDQVITKLNDQDTLQVV